MAEYAKRPEITVSTMGKVHNPTGQGVQAVSSQVQAKLHKIKQQPDQQQQQVAEEKKKTSSSTTATTYETKVKQGTAKRNISRKKTDTNYDSSHKKQGGHGKGQWKNELLEQDALLLLQQEQDATRIMDTKDPLYDDMDPDAKYVLTSHTTTTNADTIVPSGYDPDTNKAVYGPLWTRAEFKAQLGWSMAEYFDACDSEEVVRTLTELKCRAYHVDIVKQVVSRAMDQGPRERELTSQLLTVLKEKKIVPDMETGFTMLLDGLDELRKDVPDAETMAASFLARAVVDEVLPPAFLSEQNNVRPGDPVIAKAIALLSREHCTARLERVWGPGDGRPVDELKRDMDQLLKEYLWSRELDEAARCVQELQAPHFHHELVKRGVVTAMEMDADGNHLDAMAALLGFLVNNAIVSSEQVQKGVQRLHKRLPDIALDVPAAPQLLQAFEELAVQQGCLEEATKSGVATEVVEEPKK